MKKSNQVLNETLVMYEQAIQLANQIKCADTLHGVVYGNMKLV